jgi:hypothetical protein
LVALDHELVVDSRHSAEAEELLDLLGPLHLRLLLDLLDEQSSDGIFKN